MTGAPPTQRQLRVAEGIRHVLAGLFTRGAFREPLLGSANITVTEVRVSPDLRQATVFVSRLGRTDIDALLPVLDRARAYLRGEVARALRLRLAPDLVFAADRALDRAAALETLLRSPVVARDLDHG